MYIIIYIYIYVYNHINIYIYVCVFRYMYLSIYMSNRKNPGNTKYLFDGHWLMEIVKNTR